MRERVGNAGASLRQLLALLLAILAVKGILLYLDPTPHLFLGDSRSYLSTAFEGWIPPDRSFVYGYFLRLVAVWPHSLWSMVCWQTLLSALSAWLAAVCLVRYLNASLLVGTVCGLLCAIEPLQLLAERYVMTEALVTFAFAVFALLCFRYIYDARFWVLALVQVVGVLLISLRISFLPMVILCSFMLPWFQERTGSRWRALVLPTLFGLLLSQTLLFGYRHLYGELIAAPMHGHPAYFYRDGLFLMSDLAPVLKPVDYPVASQRAELFRPSPVPLPDPKARDAQRWYPDGICDRVIKLCQGDEQCADRLARKTAWHAVRRDPLGVAGLAVRTGELFFEEPYFQSTLSTDEGYDIDLFPDMAAFYRSRLAVDFTALVAHSRKIPAIVERWHRALGNWYRFLLISALLYPLYLLAACGRAGRAQWLCAVFLLLFLEGAVVTVTRPTARFLTTMSWLTLVALGSCVRTSRASPAARQDARAAAHVAPFG